MPNVQVDEHKMTAWCYRHLGSGPAQILFQTGHLSVVRGMRLEDGRAVVVKVRPAAKRLAACAAVQRRLFRAGFPCPEPLAGPEPLGGFAASAETLVPGGEITTEASRHAALLARLVQLAPAAGEVGELAPAPPWAAWDHPEPGVWPTPDDRAENLDTVMTAPWLDDIAVAVKERLALLEAEAVVGHGDFEAQNVRWSGAQPLVVHDWDSAIAAPEPVLVGLAAAVWPAGMDSHQADVTQTEEFLEAYQEARRVRWRRDEVEAAWAAGLWVLAFNAKKASLDGFESLSLAEAAQRMKRAGL